MKKVSTFAICAFLLAVAGCSEPGRYPVSGEECAPTDPVQDMRASDCLVPAL
ncbi:hypothetical protein DFP92_10339 [Yoonia sediminilitoris]|uniref:Lipoprotein n=1 Tax=Yoonia sediminilitoris TaxID=1286148 RepID=A0A2T6KJR7_9RHOB|nr:hypothetical protein [Yoonia sediminilitoris]PUB16186.1 hypothetical protein C8N45_10339 [Yoonia sediminilitoris]RCW96535.1 hypothetical protein DFP92_10339 [Yoonia sediminilitoris]